MEKNESKDAELDFERKKIKLEHKTYFNLLKRKVQLGWKLFVILYDNFYTSDFNNTRNSLYLVIGLPTFFLVTQNLLGRDSPLRGMLLTCSSLSAFVLFLYNFNQEVDKLCEKSGSKTGQNIRKVRNELKLYNPFNKSFANQKNKKV